MPVPICMSMYFYIIPIIYFLVMYMCDKWYAIANLLILMFLHSHVICRFQLMWDADSITVLGNIQLEVQTFFLDLSYLFDSKSLR